MKAYADLVTIGRIVKPQGRKGEVLTEPLTDRPERFPTLRRAFVPAAGGGSREVRVTSCWPHKARFVLKFEGVDSIDDAETYRGFELRIAPEELPALPEGAYYQHDLVGLSAQDPGGRDLGSVAAILETGAAPVLVIRGDRGETMIPLAMPFIRRVDLEARRIVLSVPEVAEVVRPGAAGGRRL